MLDADQLVAFILGHKWLGLAILFLTYFGRLLKSDSAFPISLDRLRPLAILVTGQILFACVAVQSGVPIKNAVVTALVVGLVTMGGFAVVVKTCWGDRELPAWLKVLVLVFPPKPPSIPPPPKGPSKIPLGVVTLLAALLAACTPAEAKLAVDGARAVECVFSSNAKTSAEIVAECAKENVPPEDVIHLFEKKQAAQKAAYAQGKLEGQHFGCGGAK